MAANLLAQIERLWTNLRGLGVRRLSALALIGLAAEADAHHRLAILKQLPLPALVAQRPDINSA